MANLSPYSAFIRLLFEALEAASTTQQQGVPARLGFAPPDQPYQVQDAGDPNYVYVRFEAGQGPARGWAHALNLGRVNPIDNLPVRVQLVGKEYQVLGPDGIEAALFDGGVGIGIGIGVHYHDFGPLFELVSEHRLKPGLLTPYAPDGQTYTTQCFVEAFTYVLDGVRHYVERQPTADLADRWPPSAGKRIVAVGYDTGAQTLVYANGAVVGANIALGPADLAAIALTGEGIVIPLDGVVLKYGTTQIDKSTPFIRHGRPWLAHLFDPATAQFNAAQIQDRAVHTAAPSDGQGLVWNAGESRWEPGAVSGGGPLDNLTATTDPAADDDSDNGYSAGSRWLNTTTNRAWVCFDATVGAAVWRSATPYVSAGFPYAGVSISQPEGVAAGHYEVAMSTGSLQTLGTPDQDDLLVFFRSGVPSKNNLVNVLFLHGAKSSPVDADFFTIYDTENDVIKTLTLSNLRVALQTALDDLTDVDASGAQDGDALVYDSGTNVWVPGTLAGGAMPRTRVYRSTSQSIVRVTPTAIAFDTERYDTDDGWDSGQPTQLVIPEDGIYAVGAHIQLLSVPLNTNNYLKLTVNGTVDIALQQGAGVAISNNPTTNILVPAFAFSAGDYIEVLVNHVYSSNLNTGAGTSTNWSQCDFWYQKIAN